ncbi:MAG TPA: hypothetical protein VLH59_15685 [Ignavibacteriaceae bacterium]|nr:hypothetical protein [Ignavibacteriaceae bacterium]
MKKIILILFILIIEAVTAQPKFSEMAVSPGAFSRIGFGARGIGMGNALSSITEGELTSYYNPAITPFQENNSFQAGYSFLTLDRALNYFNYTRRFDFYSVKDTLAETRKPRTTAGLSIGVINSGVRNIDGRDNNGLPTGELSTSENQFFIGLAARISEKFSIGLATKFYYYSLYEEISSTSLGFDVGALYKLNDNFNVSFVLVDLMSKYKWDTSPVYQQEGIISEDKFPNLRKLGVSYRNKELGLIGAVEFENSNAETNILRAGIEYNLYDKFFIRGGVDQFNLTNTDWPVKPSLGFSFFQPFGNLVVGVDYAFQIEQYSSADRHILSVNFNF